MKTEYVMPKLAMAMNEGTVSTWLIETGQHVDKGSNIATVETEKVAYDLEAPQSGFFHIVIPSGETVPVESVIGYFFETEAALSEFTASSEQSAAPKESSAVASTPAAQSSPAPQPTPSQINEVSQVSGRIKASPLARKLAAENQLSITQLNGSGPGGRIVKRDIEQALTQGLNTSLVSQTLQGPLRELARIPVKGIRSTIARRMVESLQTSAQLTTFWESDITGLLAMRKRFLERETNLGTRVSMNAFLIRAIACAAKHVPLANSALHNDEIVLYESINVGIAVALPGTTAYDSSLIVPVLKGVERMGVVEIDIAMKALIERAKGGSLTADDMSDSTITLSSTAGLAPPGAVGTPILNLPNAALVGPSTPIERPAVHKGEITVRTLMPVALTFDHRILDGEPATRFARYLHDCLENPELMLA